MRNDTMIRPMKPTKHYKAWLSLAMRDCQLESQGIDALGSPAFWVSKQIKTFGEVAKHSDGQEFRKAKFTDQFSEISPTTTAFAPLTKNKMLDFALYFVNLNEHVKTEERKGTQTTSGLGQKAAFSWYLVSKGSPNKRGKQGTTGPLGMLQNSAFNGVAFGFPFNGEKGSSPFRQRPVDVGTTGTPFVFPFLSPGRNEAQQMEEKNLWT